MNDEELKKEIDAKFPPIEVSKEDFADAMSKAMVNTRMKNILTVHPILGMALTLFSACLAKRIWGEGNFQEEDLSKKIVLRRSVYDEALADEIGKIQSKGLKDFTIPVLLTAFGMELALCLWEEEEKHEAGSEDAIVGNNAAAVNSEC